MVNKTFEFQPRLALIFANFKTVLKIFEVLDEESEIDIENFAKYIRTIITERIQEIKLWKTEIENKNKHYFIKFYLGDNWKVNTGYICIQIDLPYASKVFDNSAWVGLYVPEEWPQNQKFREKLKEALPHNFMNDWEEPDYESPIWSFVEYQDYAKGDNFDMDGFVDKIEELVRKLVKKKDIIDKTIKKFNK